MADLNEVSVPTALSQEQFDQFMRTRRQMVALEVLVDDLQTHMVNQLSIIRGAAQQCCPECREKIEQLLYTLIASGLYPQP